MKRTVIFVGKSTPRAELELELRDSENCPVFSVSGTVQRRCWGQCIEEVAKVYQNEPLAIEIRDLWRKYHLNDMNADCEHGINEKEADKVLTINIYSLKVETIRLQNDIERRVKEYLLAGNTVKLSIKERTILGLPYSVNEYQIPHGCKQFYKLSEVKHERAGHVRSTDHPDGVLCKACPVCGYKYGTKWNYRPIPEKDLARIKEIIETGK